MKVFKYVLFITATLFLVAITAYSYYGGLASISPQIKTCGGEVIVYEKLLGDYSQSEAVSQRVYKRLRKEFEIETKKGFGIYYDKPGTVESFNLRSEVGCILEPEDHNRAADLMSVFFVETYPVEEYLVTEFPYKGAASLMIGVMKVYPAMEKFVRKNGYDLNTPVMEIWDAPNGIITYRKKLTRSVASLERN